MLAMVLMNQSHVVVAAPVFGPLVEAIQFAKRPAQFLEFRFRHAVEIHALFELTVFVGVFVGRACVDFKVARFRLDIRRLDFSECSCRRSCNLE